MRGGDVTCQFVLVLCPTAATKRTAVLELQLSFVWCSGQIGWMGSPDVEFLMLRCRLFYTPRGFISVYTNNRVVKSNSFTLSVSGQMLIPVNRF